MRFQMGWCLGLSLRQQLGLVGGPLAAGPLAAGPFAAGPIAAEP